MNIPKIKFIPMTLSENIEVIKWAYFENNKNLDVHHYTIDYFPELKEFESSSSNEVIHKKIEEVVTKDYNTYIDKIKNEVKRYEKIWNKYNEKYFQTLANYLNINWPNKEITAKVGLIPVFPRYLDTFSFSVSTNLTDKKITEVIAHETLHFLWFEKWHELHPETPRREYDSPYLVWKYSEMVTDPILNNSVFKEMFSFVEKGYDTFYQMKDKDRLVMDNLREIYSKNTRIEEKINKGYEYIKKNVNKSK